MTVTRVWVDTFLGVTQWEFDTPLVWTGGIPAGFELLIDGAWEDCGDINDFGPDWLQLDYDDTDATLWRLVPPVANVTFPGAVVRAQEGTVG